MAIKISVKTNVDDVRYICEKVKDIPELTPRPINKLRELSERNKISTARDEGKIVGWVISEPLSKGVFELGMGFVEKPYRGKGLLYKMLRPLVKDEGASYVFATFEPRIIRSMREELGFEKASLMEVATISRGKFISKRLSNLGVTKRVANHLSKKKALYGIRRGKKA